MKHAKRLSKRINKKPTDDTDSEEDDLVSITLACKNFKYLDISLHQISRSHIYKDIRLKKLRRFLTYHLCVQ